MIKAYSSVLSSAAVLTKRVACEIRARLASENAASICEKMKKKSAQTKLILINQFHVAVVVA